MYEIVEIYHGNERSLFITDNLREAAIRYSSYMETDIFCRLKINGQILKIYEAEEVVKKCKIKRRWPYSKPDTKECESLFTACHGDPITTVYV